jgi:hypothetical protein
MLQPQPAYFGAVPSAAATKKPAPDLSEFDLLA